MQNKYYFTTEFKLVLFSIFNLFISFFSGSGSALGESVSFSHAQAVLYCLASNFLEVKQLACNLLQKLPPAAVRLQVSVKVRVWHYYWAMFKWIWTYVLLCRSRRDCSLCFRSLWTSAQAPNPSTASLPLIFSTCCCTSRVCRMRYSTVSRSSTSLSSHQHWSSPRRLRLPVWSRTLWQVR